MTDQTISLCMVVHNDGSTLARCLKSALPLVQDIVLVDLGSLDNTPQIARQYAARLLPFEHNEDEAAAWNYALASATGKWILALDANEQVPQSSYEPLQRNVIPWKEEGPLLCYFGRVLFFSTEKPKPVQPQALFPKVTLFPHHPGFRYVQPVFAHLRFDGPADAAHWLKVPDLVIHHYVRQGSGPDREHLERLMARDTENLSLRFQYCRLLFSKKDYVRTLPEAYTVLNANYPENRINPLNLALVCYFGAFSALQLNRPGDAAELALTGIWKQYTVYSLWQVLALAYSALQRQPSWINRIEESLELEVARRWLADPGSSEAKVRQWGAFFLLGYLHCLQKQYDTASRLFEQAGVLAPALAAPFIAQIEIALFTENVEAALQAIQQKGDRFPQFRETVAGLVAQLEQFKLLPSRIPVDRQARLRPALALLTQMKEDWTS